MHQIELDAIEKCPSQTAQTYHVPFVVHSLQIGHGVKSPMRIKKETLSAHRSDGLGGRANEADAVAAVMLVEPEIIAITFPIADHLAWNKFVISSDGLTCVLCFGTLPRSTRVINAWHFVIH